MSADSDYFYFCTDEERLRQSRSANENEDHVVFCNSNTNNHHQQNHHNNNPNNELTPITGPYKFDETNRYDGDSDHDDDQDSNGTVHIHDNDDDDEDPELQITANRRRSDESSGSLANHSRDLNSRGEISPLFIFFDCRVVTKDYDDHKTVNTIPLCISKKNII